jgi:hypothetical protein
MGILLNVLRVLWAIVNLKKSQETAPTFPKTGPAVPPKPVIPEEPLHPPEAVLPVHTPADAQKAQVIRVPSETCLKQGWSKDVSDCHPRIQAAWAAFVPWFSAKYPHLAMRADYTWRSQEFQMTLWAKGRKLQADGTWVVVDPKQVVTKVQKSHHNTYPAQALDFIIFQANKPLWASVGENGALYVECGKFFAAQGVVAGAVWKYEWKDPGHIQVAYTVV